MHVVVIVEENPTMVDHCLIESLQVISIDTVFLLIIVCKAKGEVFEVTFVLLPLYCDILPMAAKTGVSSYVTIWNSQIQDL